MTDPRAALNDLVTALERHLEAAAGRRGENDPVVLAAYRGVAEAFEDYDDALLDAFDEVTPLEVFRGDEEDDEDEDDDEDDAEPHFPLVIGAVLRFPENRKFPGDFELEVDDLMRSILEGRAMDAGQKRIDNLLGET
jgi:hypothetical protein